MHMCFVGVSCVQHWGSDSLSRRWTRPEFLYCPLDFEDDMIVTADVSRYIEDPGFGYEDFARRGEEHLPTFRAQVHSTFNLEKLESPALPRENC